MALFGTEGTNPNAIGWDYTHITGAGTFVIATTGPIVLHAVNVNSVGTLCTIYDWNNSTVTSQPIVGVLQTTARTATNIYDARLFNGLTVVTTGSGSDLTISWYPVIP
jgi:hypothetical protein